jgi:hypothetical protein
MTEFEYALITLTWTTNRLAHSINEDYQHLQQTHDLDNYNRLRVPIVCSYLHCDEPGLKFDIDDWGWYCRPIMKAAETQTDSNEEGSEIISLQSVLDCIERVHGIQLSFDEIRKETISQTERDS